MEKMENNNYNRIELKYYEPNVLKGNIYAHVQLPGYTQMANATQYICIN